VLPGVKVGKGLRPGGGLVAPDVIPYRASSVVCSPVLLPGVHCGELVRCKEGNRSKSCIWKLGTAACKGGVETSEMPIRAINAEGSCENKQVSPARQFPFRKYLVARVLVPEEKVSTVQA
jgi:hypothetical protein